MKTKNKKRPLKKITFTILIAFAVVSFWRGIWGLMDLYLFPQNQVLSFFVSCIIGLAILYSTKNLLKSLI